MSHPAAWYCPSRWLMAHHDPRANISTLSSHMCLADFNNDGESLLALIDFKERTITGQQQADLSNSQNSIYSARLRVYRGQQLIYNHFLDEMPSSMIATSLRLPEQTASGPNKFSNKQIDGVGALITFTINDDVYLYKKLKPSHKISLEDDEFILETLNKSEIDAWKMVRQDKVNAESMRELLIGLSNELGNNELTSHSNNFLALNSNEDRRNYLMLWKFKRLENGFGEHLMSMDTICCSAARFRFDSKVTRSGDFGQTRETGTFLRNARWNRILDIQKDGIVLGTEDRHLLIYELKTNRAQIEFNYRLPSTPDHILIERRSPSSFDNKTELKSLTYKILVSCRNCRIYGLDQTYLVDSRQSLCDTSGTFIELLALKCNVLDMSWTGDEALVVKGKTYPNFVVACLDRKIYCFGGLNSNCKWVIELESPITAIIAITLSPSDANSSCLIGVATHSNRIDFYLSLTGRIVDSIYLNNDHCQAMTFGRFGREDNCLCLTTENGHLMIFILKRAAKFAHGQCLSSAALHAADVISKCSNELKMSQSSIGETNERQYELKLAGKQASLPSPFALSKSSIQNSTDLALDLIQSDHNCDQVMVKSKLDAHLVAPQLQLPVKNRDFVDQIVEQSRHSTAISRLFAKHMVKFRDKVKSTIEQQCGKRTLDSNCADGNKITLVQVTGLGNTYRVSLSLRLNLEKYAASVEQQPNHLLSGSPKSDKRRQRDNGDEEGQRQQKSTNSTNNNLKIVSEERIGTNLIVSVFAFICNNRESCCQVKPFRYELILTRAEGSRNGWILDRVIEFRLQTGAATTDQQFSSNYRGSNQEESVALDIYALAAPEGSPGRRLRNADESQVPVFISSVNIPTC